MNYHPGSMHGINTLGGVLPKRAPTVPTDCPTCNGATAQAPPPAPVRMFNNPEMMLWIALAFGLGMLLKK
jgi:hypothetical protein